MLKTRPNCYDLEICDQVPGEYYPHLIDYPALQTCIDIGGHIGTFTAFVKTQAPECRIKTVELDAANYALLKVNTRQWTDVSTYHRLCGYDAGFNAYLRNVENYGNIALIKDGEPIPPGYELVTNLPARITLEELITEWERVDLLKLDCEGSEFDILSHVNRETLAKFTWIVGEYHTHAGDFKALVNTLHDFEVIELEAAPDWGHFLLRNKHK
jgi:FkbM family methyltransferase